MHDDKKNKDGFEGALCCKPCADGYPCINNQCVEGGTCSCAVCNADEFCNEFGECQPGF
jgi:hypothetical protein